jgi:hypothetical protein
MIDGYERTPKRLQMFDAHLEINIPAKEYRKINWTKWQRHHLYRHQQQHQQHQQL